MAGIVATSYTRVARGGVVADTDAAGFPAVGAGVSEAAEVSLAARRAAAGASLAQGCAWVGQLVLWQELAVPQGGEAGVQMGS